MIKKIIVIFFLLILFSTCLNNYALTKNEKILTFLKYDELFHNSSNQEFNGIEKGYKYEIFNINKISPEYQEAALEYKNILSDFISENLIHFKTLFTPRNGKYFLKKHLEKLYEGYEYAYYSFEKLKKNMNEYFETKDTLVRSICGWKETFLFQFGRELKNGISTILPYYEVEGAIGVYWDFYYLAQKWNYEPLYEDDGKIFNRDLKQDYWFYESNMKLIVVQRIRDEEKNYLGELSMVFYKLDNYEILFNSDGSPKQQVTNHSRG
jgi:hypothetical protein